MPKTKFQRIRSVRHRHLNMEQFPTQEEVKMKTAYALRERESHEDEPYNTDVLEPGWVEVIILLVEEGPVEDGDFPSKVARDSLIAHGYAQYVVLKNMQAGCVATYKGGYLYCQLFDKYPGLAEAIAFHKANPYFLRELFNRQRREALG